MCVNMLSPETGSMLVWHKELLLVNDFYLAFCKNLTLHHDFENKNFEFWVILLLHKYVEMCNLVKQHFIL